VAAFGQFRIEKNQKRLVKVFDNGRLVLDRIAIDFMSEALKFIPPNAVNFSLFVFISMMRDGMHKPFDFSAKFLVNFGSGLGVE
jgi:hypothetical protein